MKAHARAIQLALSLTMALALTAGLVLTAGAADNHATVRILAYINISSGCQQPTVDLLKRLASDNPARVQLEFVNFGDQDGGLQRWRQSGYHCMTIEINGSPYAKFPEGGKEKVVAFEMPAGFQWTHEDLKAAVAAGLKGDLQPATAAEVAAAKAPTLHIKVSVLQGIISRRHVAKVLIGRQRAMLITQTFGNERPKARADSAAKTLKEWLKAPVKPSDIEIKPVRRGWAVLVGSREVIVAGSADARAAGASTQAVASDWAEGIRSTVMTIARRR